MDEVIKVNLVVEAQFRAPREVAIEQLFTDLVAFLDEYSSTRLIDLDAGLNTSQQMIFFSAEIQQRLTDELEAFVRDELSQIMRSVTGEAHEPELISITLESWDQKLISSL